MGSRSRKLAVENPRRWSAGATGGCNGRPARPITPSIIEFWRLELESYDASPPLRAHMLMVWNTPRELKWAGDLSPGDSLQAEILRRGKVIARASFAVTRDPLMDVLIMDLPIESSPRP